CGDDPPQSSRDDPLRAWSGAARVAARFEVDEHRGAASAIAGIFDCEDLRVRRAGARMAALADDHAVRGHDYRADQGIGSCDAFSATGVKQRASHEVGLGHHFSWKIASTYSRGENGRR